MKFAASCPATSPAAMMEHCFALRKKVDYLMQTRLQVEAPIADTGLTE